MARSDTIRNINRQIVLNYVRERAPISRAAIAHETELQRSTISLIVDELKEQGLIDEIEGESTGGRPPTLLQLRVAGPVALFSQLDPGAAFADDIFCEQRINRATDSCFKRRPCPAEAKQRAHGVCKYLAV